MSSVLLGKQRAELPLIIHHVTDYTSLFISFLALFTWLFSCLPYVAQAVCLFSSVEAGSFSSDVTLDLAQNR